MIATLRFIVDLTVAAGTVVMMLVTAAVEWRRKPYTRQDFSQAMERICRGVEELWRVQDEVLFSGWEAVAGANQAREHLRRLCRRMLRDMLRNTCYILERTEPCLPDVRRRGPRIEGREARTAETNRRAAEVVRQGTRLVFRLRWAQVRAALGAGTETVFALTAEMAEAYAVMWSELVSFLEAKVPERWPSHACRESSAERAVL